MLVSKSKAAKLAGVSRTTIHRYSKDGRLSMTGDQVDTSELIRVFGKISVQADTPVQTDQLAHRVTIGEQVLLQDKIGLLESRIKDLADDRDQWRIKTSELTGLLKNEQENIRLLTHQGHAPKESHVVTMLSTIASAVLTGAILIAIVYAVARIFSN